MLSRLTTRLLQTANLDAQEVNLRRTKLSILALTESTIQQQTLEGRTRLQLSAESGLVDVEADRQLVELAVLQLMDNALKYSSVGSMIKVMITQDTFETAFTVGNSGYVVRAEERERIFERFSRGPVQRMGQREQCLVFPLSRKWPKRMEGRLAFRPRMT